MDPARTRTWLILGLALFLRNYLCAAPVGTHSLCLNFTVKSQVQPGQPRCEVQGSVDQTPALQYNSVTKEATPLGPLKKEVNATNAWTTLTEELDHVGQDLQMRLPDIKPETDKTGGHPTLEVKMFCQFDGKQCINASLLFSTDGQKFLYFDARSNNWTVIHPGARRVKEKWENDRDLGQHFTRVSMGDCCFWLQEFLEHWKEMPASTSETPHTTQSPTNSWTIAGIVFGVLIGIGVLIFIVIIIVIVFLVFMFCKRRCTMGGRSLNDNNPSFQDEQPLHSPQSNGPSGDQLEPLNQATS